MAAEHLIDIGRRRLSFLGAREEVRQVRECLQGAREAVARHPGVALEVDVVRAHHRTSGPAAGARVAALDAADRGPTASSPRTTTWDAVSCTAW